MPPTTRDLLPNSTIPDSALQLVDMTDSMDGNLWKLRFQALIEQLPVMLYTTPPDNLSKVEYTSSQFTQWLGYPEDDWLDSPEFFNSKVHPDDLDRVLTNDAEAIATGESFTIEYRLQAADGSWRWVRDSAILLRDNDGAALAWQGVGIDITDIKEAEARQVEARRLYRSLIEQVPAVVFRESVDDPPVALYVSPQVEDLLGYTPDEWLQDPHIWERLRHPQDRTRPLPGERHSADTDQHEHQLITKDGRTIWVREDRELIVDRHGNPDCWQGLLIDITRQKQLEEQLVFQARHDPLTGLPNRNYFSELVTTALENGTPGRERVALLFLDLDGFKLLNDNLGHHTGDDLLIEIGARLRKALRPGDIVARLGGDEFAILPQGPVNHDDVIGIAERVLDAIRQPVAVGRHQARCSGSLGIAFGEAGEDSLFDLLRWADLAMYRAKSSGKNRYTFFDAPSSRSAE